MRMRIRIDAVIDFKDRKTLPIVKPNDFVEGGLRSIMKPDEVVDIEAGVLCETTRLGKTGKRMITKKELEDA